MSARNLVLWAAPAIFAAAATSCAQGQVGNDAGGPDEDGAPSVDGPPSCGELCDQDGDGVLDGSDECPDTPAGEVVNQVGCSDSQVTPTLEPTFPPYDMVWTPTGDLGRPGGLTWTYTGMQRGDLFHIYWIVCDDPETPCGLSLDGAINAPSENWQFSAADSDLPGGRLVFSNATSIPLADSTVRPLTGRLTVTIVDGSDAPIAFADLASLGVTGRSGQYGAEIPGTDFEVVALAEVQDTLTSTWTPYLDYYDAAPTPEPGGTTATSFGGSFYDE